jgi:ankyrin repeat protein
VQNIDNISKNQTLNSQKYVDINCREPKFQMTPLMIAGLRGSRDIVLYLINHGANVALRDVKGYTFFVYIFYTFKLEIKLFITQKRNTALQLACMKQRFHVIDALLQNKANPNDVNMSGWNCLISAVNYFHEDSATMLLLLLQVIS